MSRIIWSEAERAQIVTRAVDLKYEQPQLSGLALLRAATEVLPEDRRRRLIALSQAPWFSEMFADMFARQAALIVAEGDVKALREFQLDWKAIHLDWKKIHTEFFDNCQEWVPAILEQLKTLTEEVRDLKRR